MAPLSGGWSLERGFRSGKQGFSVGNSDRFGGARGEFSVSLAVTSLATSLSLGLDGLAAF